MTVEIMLLNVKITGNSPIEQVNTPTGDSFNQQLDFSGGEHLSKKDKFIPQSKLSS